MVLALEFFFTVDEFFHQQLFLRQISQQTLAFFRRQVFSFEENSLIQSLYSSVVQMNLAGLPATTQLSGTLR
jgi:hypothetical protein